MKAIIPMSIAVVLYTLFCYETAPINRSKSDTQPVKDTYINKSGLEFKVQSTEVNTRYSEFPSGTFKNKLIVVSSKKIGGLGNGIDPATNEPFSELFCMDIGQSADLSNPLLFSRILNTKHNEGQVAFSPDESTIYYTRSLRENSSNYQLYKAKLEKDSHGNWIDHVQLTLNSTYSIETPHVSNDGKTLYFSSNKPGGLGGYDLYKAEIKTDGSIGIPENLGAVINTEGDDKYPHLSGDGKDLYFASNGHDGLGGFDLFVSKSVFDIFETPSNLGPQVNSSYDELALSFISEESGFFSSNKIGGKGSFDLYKFSAKPIEQTLQGIVVADESNLPLPESKVVLLDAEGKEIASQTTGIDAAFSFNVQAFQNYKLLILKEGFEENEIAFQADNERRSVYKQVLKLNSLAKKK